jgi:hypothetical protein
MDEAAYDPRRHLQGFPEEALDLLRAAHEAMKHTRDLVIDDFGITAGFRCLGDEVRLAEPRKDAEEHGLWMFGTFGDPPAKAIAPLAKRHSLGAQQAELAVELAAAIDRGGAGLSAAQVEALRKTEDRGASPDGEAKSRRLLGALGFRW